MRFRINLDYVGAVSLLNFLQLFDSVYLYSCVVAAAAVGIVEVEVISILYFRRDVSFHEYYMAKKNALIFLCFRYKLQVEQKKQLLLASIEIGAVIKSTLKC